MEGLLLYVFYRTVWQKKSTLRADKCVHSLMEVSERICSISRECTHIVAISIWLRPIGYFTIFLPLCMKTPPLGLVVAVPESV